MPGCGGILSLWFGTRGKWGRRSSLRRWQDHRGPGRNGPGEANNSRAHDQPDGREAVAARASGQDLAQARGHRGVHRRAEEYWAGDAHAYQILIWRGDRRAEFPHLELFRARSWGLIIYDEVHLLPAAVFRATADLQARRRLGLTATLVREDGRESDVFALIGPKRFDVPWKDLERQAWIAAATCIELRVPMSAERRMEYALAERRSQFRVAAENPAKMIHLRELLERYPGGRILIIGEYIEQVETIATEIGAPLVAGKTPQIERERIYEGFRKGELRCIVLSKVGNFAIDLPDADLLIQVSGAFGSRQEEAQRLGRVLRPKG